MGKIIHRHSEQRQKIYELIKKSSEHPTAMFIYETLRAKIPNLSLGTVYRNLNVLVELGLIRRLPFSDTFDRFDANLEMHHHLICEKCGRVEDIMAPNIAVINRDAVKDEKFKILRHKIDFYGICEKCNKNR